MSTSAPVSGPAATTEQLLHLLSFEGSWNTNVVMAGTTALGLAAGVVGVFLTLRGRALVADALGHATLPGVCLAFILAPALGFDERSLPVLLVGGALTAGMAAIAIPRLTARSRLTEDTAIALVLATWFALGIVLMDVVRALTSSNVAGLDAFLFGQTAAMVARDAWWTGGLALLVVVAVAVFRKEIALVCFDERFARVSGWSVAGIDGLMMLLAVLVILSGLPAVGLLLVVALLVIPAVAARFWTERLGRQLVIAGAIGALSGWVGSALSALTPGLPAGAVIVLVSGAAFVASMFLAPARGILAALGRRLVFRIRIAEDHLLEAMFVRAQARGGGEVLSVADWRGLAAVRGWPGWFRPLMARWLAFRGLARRHPEGLIATRAGAARGARIRRNHKLWEQYLLSHADVAPRHVDWSVDQVEHVLSNTLVQELEAALRARGIIVPSPPEATA